MEMIEREKRRQEVALQLRRRALPTRKSLEDSEAKEGKPGKGSAGRGNGRKRARQPEAASSSDGPMGGGRRSKRRRKRDDKRHIPFVEEKVREVSLKELQAERRALAQEAKGLIQLDTRTGGNSTDKPTVYPIGPKPKGKEDRSRLTDEKRQLQDFTCVGQPTKGLATEDHPVMSPPGLTMPAPPAPAVAKESKRQRRMAKEPTPQISTEDFSSLGQALDIWSLIENAQGNPHLNDSIFYNEPAMQFARQGEVFRLGAHRTSNFTYANRAARGDWKQRTHFGEVVKGYSPEDEFPDALVRCRQSQYDVVEERMK